MEGYGRVIYNNGGIHEGYHKKGKMNGLCYVYYKDAYEYKGNFKNNYLHGKGSFYDI